MSAFVAYQRLRMPGPEHKEFAGRAIGHQRQLLAQFGGEDAQVVDRPGDLLDGILVWDIGVALIGEDPSHVAADAAAEHQMGLRNLDGRP